MSAPIVAPVAPSPLGRLALADRERAIAVINQTLDADEAPHALAALAGTRAEAAALPDSIQDRLLHAILKAFPAGHAAVIVSRLGLARVGVDTWLPALQQGYEGKALDDIIREIEQCH